MTATVKVASINTGYKNIYSGSLESENNIINDEHANESVYQNEDRTTSKKKGMSTLGKVAIALLITLFFGGAIIAIGTFIVAAIITLVSVAAGFILTVGAIALPIILIIITAVIIVLLPFPIPII